MKADWHPAMPKMTMVFIIRWMTERAPSNYVGSEVYTGEESSIDTVPQSLQDANKQVDPPPSHYLESARSLRDWQTHHRDGKIQQTYCAKGYEGMT